MGRRCTSPQTSLLFSRKTSRKENNQHLFVAITGEPAGNNLLRGDPLLLDIQDEHRPSFPALGPKVFVRFFIRLKCYIFITTWINYSCRNVSCLCIHLFNFLSPWHKRCSTLGPADKVNLICHSYLLFSFETVFKIISNCEYQ